MKHIALICALALVPQTGSAEEADTPFALDDLTPFAEGFRELFEGLADEMLPLMEQLSDHMPDLNAYEAPEVLPNGDIIIRRKPKNEAAPDHKPKGNSDGSIEL